MINQRQGLSVLVMGLWLLGCSEAPLKSAPKEKQVAVLLKASRTAEKAMGLYTPPGGGYYLNCLKANEAQIDCGQFLTTMLTALQKDPAFRKVSIEELQDHALFAELTEAYQARFFSALED